MGRPIKEMPFSSALAPALLRLLHQRGVPAAEIGRVIDELGLPNDAATLDEVSITASVQVALISAAADLCGEPHLALVLPTELRFRRYRLPELAAHASATVRQALQEISAHGATLIPGLQLTLREDGDRALW